MIDRNLKNGPMEKINVDNQKLLVKSRGGRAGGC